MSGFKYTQTADVARRAASMAGALPALLLLSTAVIAAPAIRTSDANRVPACVTPDKLMAFVHDRNPAVDPRYRGIATWYKYYGDAWRVRWDYAFFQMVLETNALKYRRGDGRRGDVHEKQNNFAGIGATGGGVPGDRFADIKTGVHAQIQHLVAYSGEHLTDPIAPRTQLRQDDIIDQSRRLRRTVTFGDLARRWAADRAYAKSIDAVAEQFRSGYCNAKAAGIAPAQEPAAVAPAPQPARRRNLSAFAPPSGLGGPKPQMLAGPDQLPWSAALAQQTPVKAHPDEDAPPSSPPAARAPADKSHKVPSVRTIWSRDGKVDPAFPAPPVERTVETAQPARPAATPPAAPAATQPVTDDAPALPRFRIEPAIAPPSRLGGPILGAPVVGARVTEQVVEPLPSGPRAHFKQVVTEPEARAAAADSACRVLAASYGGTKTLLVRAVVSGETRYTALTVLDGFEKSMFDIYSKASAPNAEVVGEYLSRDDALADARTNCPGG